MTAMIRDARPEDIDSIAGFATDTFEWGDYVVESFPAWLEQDGSVVLVAVDDADRAIGAGRAVMLSQSEAWLQGMRVHGDHRRRGIATAIQRALVARTGDLGAIVARLAVESGNAAAHHQITSAGWRPIGDWLRSARPVSVGQPAPDGNGGRPVPPRDRLQPASAVEAGPAYMAWATGSLVRPARGLFVLEWSWRRMTEAHLAESARVDALWSARSGWAMAGPDGPTLDVAWVETTGDDAFELLRALYELAASRGHERVALTVPAVDWMVAALNRSGFESFGLTVYETAV